MRQFCVLHPYSNTARRVCGLGVKSTSLANKDAHLGPRPMHASVGAPLWSNARWSSWRSVIRGQCVCVYKLAAWILMEIGGSQQKKRNGKVLIPISTSSNTIDQSVLITGPCGWIANALCFSWANRTCKAHPSNTKRQTNALVAQRTCAKASRMARHRACRNSMKP